jgi:hypothetical protein
VEEKKNTKIYGRAISMISMMMMRRSRPMDGEVWRPQIRGDSHPRMPRVGPIHTPKRPRRRISRLGFFRFAAVKEFTSMYGTRGTRYRSHNGKCGGLREGSSNYLGSASVEPSK